MKIDGSYTFHAPPDLLWSFLHNSSAIQQSIPGCEHFHLHADGKYHVSLTMPSGPFEGRYEARVTRVAEQPGASIHLSVTGSGPELVFIGEGVLHLQENPRQTVLVYEGDVEVSGQIPSQSPRLVKTTANYLQRSFLEGLDWQIQQSLGMSNDNEPSAADTAVAARAAQTIGLQEFLAELRRDKNVAAAVFLLALLAVLSILGVVFVAILAMRWLARSLSDRSSPQIGPQREGPAGPRV
jgi:hypothetical protein